MTNNFTPYLVTCLPVALACSGDPKATATLPHVEEPNAASTDELDSGVDDAGDPSTAEDAFAGEATTIRPDDPPNHDSPPPSTPDAAAPGDSADAGDGRVAADAGATPSAEASVDRDAGLSCAPKVDGCNPVKNQGCLAELGMHCAVDPLASTLAGYCIFSAAMEGGSGCLNTFVTESCPPRSSCFEGQCRKLCFCNSDCDPGACCSEPLGTLGFRTCGEC